MSGSLSLQDAGLIQCATLFHFVLIVLEAAFMGRVLIMIACKMINRKLICVIPSMSDFHPHLAGFF